MANLIAVMGESGSGKTTSLRNFDPKTTYIIDCDKKGLSWRGWRNQYNTANKNYAALDDQSKVLAHLMSINGNAPHIKTVVVDTLNGIMVADEGRRKGGFSMDSMKRNGLLVGAGFLLGTVGIKALTSPTAKKCYVQGVAQGLRAKSCYEDIVEQAKAQVDDIVAEASFIAVKPEEAEAPQAPAKAE